VETVPTGRIKAIYNVAKTQPRTSGVGCEVGAIGVRKIADIVLSSSVKQGQVAGRIIVTIEQFSSHGPKLKQIAAHEKTQRIKKCRVTGKHRQYVPSIRKHHQARTVSLPAYSLPQAASGEISVEIGKEAFVK